MDIRVPGTAEDQRRADATAAVPAPRRSVGLGLLLLVLPLLALVPVLVYSGVLLYLMAGQARESTERELSAADHALTAVVQRELDHAVSTLALAARAPAFVNGHVDPAQLDHLLLSVSEVNNGLQRPALFDRRGRMVRVYPPPDAPGASGLSAYHERVLATRSPVVSDLHPSQMDGQLGVTVSMPVMQGDQVAWILSAKLDPDYLPGIMRQQVGGREAVATVLDSQRRILARTAELETFYGQQPSEQTLAAVQQSPTGVRRLLTREGNEFLWSWSRTANGWTVLLGIPTRDMDETLRQSMLRLGMVGVGVLALALLATLLLVRRITLSVNRMAVDAGRLVEGETPPYRRSGIRQLDALYHALQQASGQVRRAFAERERALAAERAARASADEDNRAKDVFIATLSHELRNPLAPIRSATHVLKSPRADEARRHWAIEIIDRQAGAMARLLDDLLDISRVTSGRIRLDRQRVDLRTVLESAVETARPLLDSRGHAFSMELPQEPVLLDGDALRLAQVFANLLTNAAKYTDPGGHIAVSVQRQGTEAIVRVRDTGIGLAQHELEHVFQMFSQVRGLLDRSQGGLGIGLSLVRALVELHGGWVRAESAGPGQGSEFVVGLPAAQAEVPR